MKKEIGDEILFYHAGQETKGVIVEKDPVGYTTKYLYKAKDKMGYKYFISKEDLIS